MRKNFLAIAAVLIFFLIFGCHAKPQKYMIPADESERQAESENKEIGNPAAIHCTETAGAAWSTRESDNGQYGICTFTDGSWCDEWDYYRGNCEPGVNITRCEGQFWGKTACPTLYEPVCAKIEIGNQAPYQIKYETFSNSCTACISSTRMEVVAGYTRGRCE